ncbi:MAG: hypothetical protein IT462_14930 [Planctomycetes bacterium]|nr:hypothetical protein [Planctomycetota bacterium]
MKSLKFKACPGNPRGLDLSTLVVLFGLSPDEHRPDDGQKSEASDKDTNIPQPCEFSLPEHDQNRADEGDKVSGDSQGDGVHAAQTNISPIGIVGETLRVPLSDVALAKSESRSAAPATRLRQNCLASRPSGAYQKH